MWPTELTVGRHADLKNELNAVLGVAHPSESEGRADVDLIVEHPQGLHGPPAAGRADDA